MRTLTVRNVPDEVLRALKEMARRNRRSMEQEVRHILEATTLDRLSACAQVEEAWGAQSRPTGKEEVDRWVKSSRP